MIRSLSMLLPAFSLFVFASIAVGETSSDRLVVHEWGTFTTLQDDQGQELFGINIDDEPVPGFVHNLEPHLLDHPVLSQDYWRYRQKGTPRQHPLVSMRLETPVIYFYPPKTARLPLSVDVDVQFRSGWLTEFYPDSISQPSNDTKAFDFSRLTRESIGRLTWKGLSVGDAGEFPETDEKVWLAPRKVASTPVRTRSGESEQYLFYRGVARLAAPLRVSTSQSGDEIAIRANFDEALTSGETAQIESLWLVETRADGQMAFRRLDSLEATSDPSKVAGTAPRRFDPTDFTEDNREKLEKEMHRALLDQGLFADEATALLTTWQRAYFASPGLRLFFTVPRSWTDHYLPLTVSGDPETVRVMVGRIELVSDFQRDVLRKLSRIPEPRSDWIYKLPDNSAAVGKLRSGRSFDLRELGVDVPPEFQLYMQLGRFRNALVAWEEKRTSNRNLTYFVNSYGLGSYRVPAE